MADKAERTTAFGTFTVEPNRQVHGELSLDGANTLLYLHDPEPFRVNDERLLSITGTLRDLRYVSLLNCICIGNGTQSVAETGGYYFSEARPEFVIFGNKTFTAEDALIDNFSFMIDDALSIFYDPDVFGMSFDNRPELIRSLVEHNEKRYKRKIEVGPHPEIYYYTGKGEIFSVSTVIGTVSATHVINHGIPGTRGIRVENSVFINVKFDEPVAFQKIIYAAHALLHFFDIIAGRPQKISKMSVMLRSDSDVPSVLEIHWCEPPRRPIEEGERNPQPIDMLFDAVRSPSEFGQILSQWLSRQEPWKALRERFWLGFSQQRTYSHDRLVGAANLFDIMPSSALPPPKVLSEELSAAVEQCRQIFRKLPDNLERQSVLNELGRVGKSRLKEKIRHQVTPLMQRMPTYFPELSFVTDEAVNCRNYYVHGGSVSIDYASNFWLLVFLTNTLEFVFAATDLMDSGWDASRWGMRGTSLSHPFAIYRHMYLQNLNRLKALKTAR